MQLAPMAETGLYGAAAAILAAAAWHDLQARRIPNRLSLALACLFIPVAIVQLWSGLPPVAALVWPLVIAAVMFIAGLGLFSAGMMGGGDVKLLAAMALLAGADHIVTLVLYTAIAGGFVAVATLVHARMATGRGEMPGDHVGKVPYGVAIAIGGGWVCISHIATLQS
ncbi:MAG: peptidase [Alphaproteobacteria bacterium]|nr:MAG: peptidase [Alphaproteobacteria bacterium]